MAYVYVAEGRPTIISALHYNSDGLYYEQEDTLALPIATEDGLASALREALRRYSLRDQNLRGRKSTDWPAYRASGMKSLRSFEDTYLQIQVRALNEAEQLFEASAKARGESDVGLNVLLNPLGADEEIRRLLRRLGDACLRWSLVMPGENWPATPNGDH
jgi:hypothetical protein